MVIELYRLLLFASDIKGMMPFPGGYQGVMCMEAEEHWKGMNHSFCRGECEGVLHTHRGHGYFSERKGT